MRTLCGLVAGLLVAACLDTSSAAPLRLRSRTTDPEPGVEAAERYLEALRPARAHLLVQLAEPRDENLRRTFEEAGVRWLRYVPDETWLVSADPEFLADARIREAVRWAAPLEAGDRLHPRLRAGTVGAWAISGAAWRLRVQFHADVPAESARTRLAAVGAIVRAEEPAFHAFEIDLPQWQLARLSEADEVLWVRETAPPFQSDNDGARQSARAEEAQQTLGLNGLGVRVALWDGGCADPLHPDLLGRVINADGAPGQSHATHVGVTILGSGASSLVEGGTALQWRGLAPAATLVGYDWVNVLAEHQSAIQTFGALVSANPWSEVVSSDLGNCDIYGDYDFGAPEYDAIVRGLFGAGISIVRSVGNERNDGDCGMLGFPFDNYAIISPPATAKNVISVGATHSDTSDMTNFSSWGPVDDGRIKPEVVAAGCQAGIDFGVTSGSLGGGYYAACGTSMSAAVVSGAIAQLQQASKQTSGHAATPSLIKAVLINEARDLGRPGADYEFGFGEIDVVRAAELLETQGFAEDNLVTQGDVRVHPFQVPFGLPSLNVSLVWSDPEAAPLAATTLINDLDLVLVDPRGQSHSPWRLDPANPSAPATRGANHRDVVEQVTVSAPRMGAWLAVVSSSSLPEGPQSYSLAGTTPTVACAGSKRRVPQDYASIQDAVDASLACDTVAVAAGTYTGPFVVSKPIVLRGAGADVTTLRSTSAARVLTVTSDVVIDGFSITDGRAAGASAPQGYGGGLLAEDSSPFVRNCRFVRNHADAAGGAVAVLAGFATIENCTFDRDSTLGRGGAVYVSGAVGSTSVRGSVITRSHANGHGGGLYLEGAACAIESSTLVGNGAGGLGGGAYIATIASSTLRNIFVGNQAVGGDGALFCAGNEVVTCNDFWGNADDPPNCSSTGSNLDADPLFCDPSVQDFDLHDGSPCAPPHSPPECGLIGARPVSCDLVTVPSEEPSVFSVTSGANPIRGQLVLRLALPEDAKVTARIFDVSGRRVATLIDHRLSAGLQLLHWDGRDRSGGRASPGIYFYRVQAGSNVVERKFLLVP